jgi:RES domain-containing protein
MILWRISNHASLDGDGGLLASARWHFRGHPVVYLAESPPGALLEVLVHLELDSSALPKGYKMLKVEAADDVSIRTVERSELPAGWHQHAAITHIIGANWLASRETVLLRVPSVIVPETYNVLLNPRHPDAARLRILWHREYPWDSRLLS